MINVIFKLQATSRQPGSDNPKVIQCNRFRGIVVRAIIHLVGQGRHLQYKGRLLVSYQVKEGLTINLHIMRKRRAAAGHSGQYNTVRRSEMRLSNIARYSASFELLVALPFPDLHTIIFF